MAKTTDRTYEELSRRALIKLGHDYDSATGGKLEKFLAENNSDYEGIRVIERVVSGFDKIGEKTSELGGKFMKKLYSNIDGLLDNMLDDMRNM